MVSVNSDRPPVPVPLVYTLNSWIAKPMNYVALSESTLENDLTYLNRHTRGAIKMKKIFGQGCKVLLRPLHTSRFR